MKDFFKDLRKAIKGNADIIFIVKQYNRGYLTLPEALRSLAAIIKNYPTEA